MGIFGIPVAMAQSPFFRVSTALNAVAHGRRDFVLVTPAQKCWRQETKIGVSVSNPDLDRAFSRAAPSNQAQSRQQVREPA
jgi:hypothetical protein